MYENKTTVKRVQDKIQMESKENLEMKYFYQL